MRVKNKIEGRVKLSDVIYIALRQIGRPAHWTEIAKVCNGIYSKKVLLQEISIPLFLEILSLDLNMAIVFGFGQE